MSKKIEPQKPARVQVSAMYLHPETIRVIDAIAAEMASNRGIAVDEIVRRYRTAEAALRELRSREMESALSH